jgi:hypothetical protein
MAMLRRIVFSALVGAIAHVPPSLFAQDALSEAYAARDLCTGMAARWINVPVGTATYENGKFKVERGATGQITIFEDAVPFAQIPQFDYNKYELCVEKMIQGFDARRAQEERVRRQSELTKGLAVFDIAFNLNDLLNVGTCLREPARAGIYWGNTAQSNDTRLNSNATSKLLISMSKVLSAWAKRYLDDPIDFTLDQDVSFYRFIRDQEIPYFDVTLISRYNADLFANADPNLTRYVDLGQQSGTLFRLYSIYRVSLYFLRLNEYRADDKGARARYAFPIAMQCIERIYTSQRFRLSQRLREFNIGIGVPFLTELTSKSLQELEEDDFTERFTSKLKLYLRRQT